MVNKSLYSSICVMGIIKGIFFVSKRMANGISVGNLVGNSEDQTTFRVKCRREIVLNKTCFIDSFNFLVFLCKLNVIFILFLLIIRNAAEIFNQISFTTYYLQNFLFALCSLLFVIW
jgi:hypothetical protein